MKALEDFFGRGEMERRLEPAMALHEMGAEVVLTPLGHLEEIRLPARPGETCRGETLIDEA